MRKGAVTTPSGARIMAAPASVLRERSNPKFVRLSYEMALKYAHPKFPLVRLGDLLVERIAYGTSSRLAEDNEGYPVLRMNNLIGGRLDTTDLKYLACSPSEASSYLLRPGDVLVNRTNSDELVGKAAVFDLSGKWMFASYLLRLRVNTELARPHFVVQFLNSPAGRLQIDRLSRRAVGMTNINTVELASILIPLPSLAEQDALVAPLNRAMTERESVLSQTRRLLQDINEPLTRLLGAPSITAVSHANSYAARLSDLRRIDRLATQFFHPERIAAARAVMSCTNARPSTVGAQVDVVHEIVTPAEGVVVLGLSSVESHTGEIFDPEEGAASAKRLDETDVLYARLRPYLNKVTSARTDGLCSTEFIVLRPGTDVLPQYLAIVLRSPLVVAQTKHLATGNTLPRVTREDLEAVLIPIAPPSIQQELVDDFEQRRRKAADLRSAADEALSNQLDEFDRALFGSSP